MRTWTPSANPPPRPPLAFRAEPAIRAYVGAVFGVMMTVALDWAQQPDMDFPAAVDQALAYLEEGLPL